MGNLFTTIPYTLNCVNKLTVVDFFRWNVSQCERMCLLFKCMMFRVRNKHMGHILWQRFQLGFLNSVYEILPKDNHIKKDTVKNCQYITLALYNHLRIFFNGHFFKLVWKALSSQKTMYIYRVHRQVKLDKTLLHCLNNSLLASVLFLFSNYYRWTSLKLMG